MFTRSYIKKLCRFQGIDLPNKYMNRYAMNKWYIKQKEMLNER